MLRRAALDEVKRYWGSIPATVSADKCTGGKRVLQWAFLMSLGNTDL